MRAEARLKQRGLERESGIRIKSLIGLRIPSFTAKPKALAGTQTGIVRGGAARGGIGARRLFDAIWGSSGCSDTAWDAGATISVPGR